MSKKAIEGLKPELIWNYFYEISQIPRPSKKEEKILKYVREFAKKNNFEMKEDKTGNILISVPASGGYENAPTIVLQGHVDMVCEKNKGTEHDFDNDPIKLVRDGDWMAAEGTTLGADNGIGVAAAMAAATDPDVVHGPLEILTTVDEETGLTGANGLEPGFVSGNILLNMDSEEDGIFYIGCSGGIDTLGEFNFKWVENKKGLTPYNLMITGLKGGHSGLDVATGRANAIKLLGILLSKLSEFKFRLAEISGGSKRNAIPREAEAVILIDPKDENKIKKVIDQFVNDTLLEFQKTDGGLKIELEKSNSNVKKIMTKKLVNRLVKCLVALPHGIMKMSFDMPGLVETSTNLATITMGEDKITVGTSQRSSVDAAKVNIANRVRTIFELARAKNVRMGDGYPGWQPNVDSELLKKSIEVYKSLFNSEPGIKAIHAGLECGILGDKYPGMDMISFGPTITGAHSPDERVNINDVEKFYTLVKGILKSYCD